MCGADSKQRWRSIKHEVVRRLWISPCCSDIKGHTWSSTAEQPLSFCFPHLHILSWHLCSWYLQPVDLRLDGARPPISQRNEMFSPVFSFWSELSLHDVLDLWDWWPVLEETSVSAACVTFPTAENVQIINVLMFYSGWTKSHVWL